MKSLPIRLVPTPPSPSADVEALGRVAEGDVGALGEVYDRHACALLAFVSRATGARDAEDVVQGVFVRAARVASTYDGRASSARAWLFGIAARLIQERRRSLLRFSRALLGLGTQDMSSRMPSHDHRSDLEKGLLQLSEAKRVVLILAEVEGFTCDEIAAMLCVPVGTVWTRLHHARKELRRYYEEDV
jgi:RNA polymerase sigma-70 factor (ECF subfamily)